MITLPLLLLTLAPHWTTPGDQTQSAKVVVGYLQDDDNTPAVVQNLAYDKVTHIDFAFANPTNAAGDLSVSANLGLLVAKAHQHHVKVLISIGGGYASEDKTQRDRYFDLISPAKRSGFIAKVAKYVGANHLDGVDVDLEGDAINQDYGALITELSAALAPKGQLVTAAVSGTNGGDRIPAEALARFDFINVMAYDATGPWNRNLPGPHSSMQFAQDSVAYWVGRQVSKSKLVLGVPFYGWGFGPAFTEGGYTFAQIVDKYPGSAVVDQTGDTIYYNGIPTIQAKTRWVAQQGLGGVMIWSLNQDAAGKNSLLSAIHQALTTHNARAKKED